MSTSDERFAIIEAGFLSDHDRARRALTHSEPQLRSSALRALLRMNQLRDEDIAQACTDEHHEVRRAAVECAVSFHDVTIHHMLHDKDVFVAEMTAWALGERSGTDDELDALIVAAMGHSEAVVREASVAALGSLGDERGRSAILTACSDKPAVRRRAILALAPFDGPDIDQALTHALEDRDWQVRQNAEILMSPRGRDALDVVDEDVHIHLEQNNP